MLETFLALIDASISLIREGETRRDKFFQAVVEPIHERFGQFCSEHMQAFEAIRAGLEDPSVSIESLRDDLSRRTLFEESSWLLFRRLEDLGAKSSSEVSRAYGKYIAVVQVCLKSVMEGGERSSSIAFYYSVNRHLSTAIEMLSMPNLSEAEIREETSSALIDVIRQFNRYRTDVDVEYLRLRRLCTT